MTDAYQPRQGRGRPVARARNAPRHATSRARPWRSAAARAAAATARHRRRSAPSPACLPLRRRLHYLYCPRQCALIHIEQAWVENTATAEGRVAHERVHAAESEMRRGVRTVTGISDVVELHGIGLRMASGVPSLWGTSAAGPRRTEPTRCSSAPRPWRWRRCSR